MPTPTSSLTRAKSLSKVFPRAFARVIVGISKATGVLMYQIALEATARAQHLECLS